MKKEFRSGVCKALTMVACAAFLVSGIPGLGSISAKAAVTRNLTVDLRNNRVASFNPDTVDIWHPSKDYTDALVTAVAMRCYDSGSRVKTDEGPFSLTSNLSANPCQGFEYKRDGNGKVSLNALGGSIGTGKFVLNKRVLLQDPETAENEDDAINFLNSIESMLSGDVKKYYLNHPYDIDLEYVVEVKFSDDPVHVSYSIGSAPEISFEVGAEFEQKGISYRILDESGNVSAAKLVKEAKNVTIPATVDYAGCKFNVTDIAPNFMKNTKKTVKVTIGKNVTSIGKEAFYKCKKLKKVTIKSKKIKKIGKKAFGKNAKSFSIKMPKGYEKAYNRLLKKAK